MIAAMPIARPQAVQLSYLFLLPSFLSPSCRRPPHPPVPATAPDGIVRHSTIRERVNPGLDQPPGRNEGGAMSLCLPTTPHGDESRGFSAASGRCRLPVYVRHARSSIAIGHNRATVPEKSVAGTSLNVAKPSPNVTVQRHSLCDPALRDFPANAAPGPWQCVNRFSAHRPEAGPSLRKEPGVHRCEHFRHREAALLVGWE